MMNGKRRREIEETMGNGAGYDLDSASGMSFGCFSVSYLSGEGIISTLLVPRVNHNLPSASQSTDNSVHLRNANIPVYIESGSAGLGGYEVNHRITYGSYNTSSNDNSASNVNNSNLTDKLQSHNTCRELNTRKSPKEKTNKAGKVLLPKTVWMCFSADTKILTAGQQWEDVSDVPRRDEPLTFSFCQYETDSVLTGFRDSSGVTVTARVSQSALFYVRDKGWCALRPSIAAARYGVHVFLFLCPGDLCQPVLFQEEISLESADRSNSSSIRVKRPMNSFMLFAKKYRLELTRLHPGRDNRDISILLGEKWRKLSSEEKKGYAREAQTLAEVHKKSHPDCWKRKKSK